MDVAGLLRELHGASDRMVDEDGKSRDTANGEEACVVCSLISVRGRCRSCHCFLFISWPFLGDKGPKADRRYCPLVLDEEINNNHTKVRCGRTTRWMGKTVSDKI